MANLDDLRNALAALVAIIRGHDQLHGRARLQKLAYLLQQIRFQPLERVRFAYHHYGPYSYELAGVLDQAVASGVVTEQEHTTAEQQQSLSAFLHVTKPAHWRALELAATVVYLERHSRLDRSRAMIRALELQPSCTELQP